MSSSDDTRVKPKESCAIKKKSEQFFLFFFWAFSPFFRLFFFLFLQRWGEKCVFYPLLGIDQIPYVISIFLTTSIKYTRGFAFPIILFPHSFFTFNFFSLPLLRRFVFFAHLISATLAIFFPPSFCVSFFSIFFGFAARRSFIPFLYLSYPVNRSIFCFSFFLSLP